MLSAGGWRQNQANTILFVLVDNSGVEVAGLGSTYTLELSKAGAAFSASAGTKSEVANGWYKYVATAGEADTPGPVAIKVTHASIVQQNLEYVVQDRAEATIEFTYTLTNTVGGLPIEDANISIYSDNTAQNLVWVGETDVNGIARDSFGALPRLQAGTYYIWRQKSGFIFANPDTEVVS